MSCRVGELLFCGGVPIIDGPCGCADRRVQNDKSGRRALEILRNGRNS